MPRYRYQTVDEDGGPISGELQAGRIEEALQILNAKGLHPKPHEIEETPDAPVDPADTDRPLSTGEASRVAANLAELTQAQLPLGGGLRAMADELRDKRLSKLFRRLARRADEGVPLQTMVTEMGHLFPGHIRGLILAGTQSGRLPEVLGEFAALERERSDLSWRIRMSLAYPLFLAAGLAMLFIFSGLFIVPPMAAVLEDFDAEMPAMSTLFINASLGGTPILIVLLVTLAALFLPWLVIPRPRWLKRCLYSVPVLGSIWKWQALVEFSRLMAILIAQDVPMPEALRLTSDGVRSPDLQAACLKSATRIEAGDTFSDCIDRHRAFPATLKPFVDFANQSSRPSEGFAAAALVFQQRISVDTTLWEIILPPLALVVIGGFVGIMVVAMFLPLISLITTLS